MNVARARRFARGLSRFRRARRRECGRPARGTSRVAFGSWALGVTVRA